MDEFRALCTSVRFHDDVGSEESAAAAAEHGRQTIARLNADSLRVTPTLTPEIYRAVEAVAKALKLRNVPRAYVTADPSINAAAPLVADDQDPILMMTSGLVELLSAAELRFPIAHELGHTGLRHQHDRVSGPPGSDGKTELQTLQDYARQRAAELSADRVGMIATGSLFTAAGVMIKTASGLSSEHVRLDVDGFLKQLEREGAVNVDREWELHTSHPMLPMRLRALVKFSESDVYLKLTGTGQRGRPLKEVDAEVASWLAELGHGALATMEARRAMLAAVWAMILLIAQAGVPAGKFLAGAKDVLDTEQTKKAIRFTAEFGRPKAVEKLNSALGDLDVSSKETQRKWAENVRTVLNNMALSPEHTEIWPRLVEFATEHGCDAQLRG